MSKKAKTLLFSSGKIGEDDTDFDIAFWQSVEPNVRFRAAQELALLAFEQSTLRISPDLRVPPGFDKTIIEKGKLS